MTLGKAVGTVGRQLSKPFMPWQQMVADVVSEIDPVTGRLAYQEWGLLVPRQSGKSTLILCKSVHRCSATGFFGPRQKLVYTAQTRKKAREKWEEDYAAELEASRVFKSRVAIHKASGNEHIRFRNGSRWGIEAATEKSGHGPTIDSADIDEAFAQVDTRLELAFRPAMITRLNKQLGWISTAGWLDGSPYLEEKVRLGRAAVEADTGHGLAFFEFSAGEDEDPGDPATWWGCMPALGYTITEDAIRHEYHSTPLNDFKRSYLNLWVPKSVGSAWSVISEAQWDACLDAHSESLSVSAFAVEVDMDRAYSAIGAAGPRSDGLTHVECVDHRPGTEGLLDRCVDLDSRHGPVPFVVDRGGPAAGLIPELKDKGLDVVEAGTADVAASYGRFMDAVTAASGSTVRHGPQSELEDALKAVKTRPCGDGGQAFGRKVSGGSISALQSVALAHSYAVTQVLDVEDSVW